MWPFTKKEEVRAIEVTPEVTPTVEDVLLRALIGNEAIDKDKAMNIPAVASCVELISNTVASLPIKLYQEENGKVVELTDERISLLNDDTKDTLDGFQFKKALVVDYLLDGNGYAYINRERNKIKSLHYVDEKNVSVQVGTDPIFKTYDILVHGKTYRDFEFIKILRKSKNGGTGTGVIEESEKILSVTYNALIYEELLTKTGGNKKGFLKAQSKLSQDSIDALKIAWNNLYKNNTENVVVLNNGVEFQEASSTSVEMQLNENKKTNSNEVSKLFNVPVEMLNGSANESVYNNFVKTCILPILKSIETALNRDLLLQSEKNKSFYYVFDTKELTKGDVEKRYRAYEIASRNGFMQLDEIRYQEDLEPLGLDFIRLGLQDVLYNPKTGEIYTPNTNKAVNMSTTTSTVEDPPEGGEEDEN